MQKIFIEKQQAKNYKYPNNSLYPDAPEKCPFKKCMARKKLKKHGYYKRYIITKAYTIKIRIRRYKCKICGRTVSMLPSFCIPYYQYTADVIIDIVKDSYKYKSNSRTARKWKALINTITRRNITYYRARLRQNRKYIQYVLNQISPRYIELNQITGDNEWTKRMFDEIGVTYPSNVFNTEFHKISGQSFMSLQNIVA